MIILLMLPFLFSNFVQKWYIPQGVSGFGNTIIQILDTDRDGNLEFVFTTYGSWPAYLHFYELHLPDVWEIDSVPLPGGDLLWDSGDFDGDGLYDLALQFHIENPSLADGIMVFESPDSFSYPTDEVWRDTVGFPLVTPICVYDIDQDGLPEIVKVIGDTTIFDIYECIGDNLYQRIFRDTLVTSHSPMSTLAFGDFDLDGHNEFVFGYSGGEYSIWECTGNNMYQEIIYQQLPTLNIKDCFSVPDADGDGKLEFVVKGFVVPTARTHAFIFEATGDNTYEIIKSFNLAGGDYYGGYSEAGDVDGDSIPEIVLESASYVYIIKSAGNDSFYVWDTLPGYASGSCVRIFDIDDNGLAEIIISGNDETRIYEYELGITEEVRSKRQEVRLVVYPNPFSKLTKISFGKRHSTEGIELKIYDVSGRMIKQFDYSTMRQSDHITWDGKDIFGHQVPVGVYFVRLETSNYRETKKVILLK